MCVIIHYKNDTYQEVFGMLIVERATAEGDAFTLVASVGSMSQPRLKTK